MKYAIHYFLNLAKLCASQFMGVIRNYNRPAMPTRSQVGRQFGWLLTALASSLGAVISNNIYRDEWGAVGCICVFALASGLVCWIGARLAFSRLPATVMLAAITLISWLTA